MARAFWKGTISFGMVSIPVRMSLATESRAPSFHLLHKKCLTRPKQVLYCAQDDVYFSQKETVRGYEYERDQFVVFKDTDFDKVPVKTTHSIEIHAFVRAEEVDPLYFHGSHYIEPEKLGVKPFFMLRRALEETKLVGIAKVAFQRREHLVCLRPYGGILALHTMHYRDEILPPPEAPADEKVAVREMELALTLVKTMAGGFKPQDFRDDYASALERMVKAKIDGKPIKAAPPAPVAETADLMAMLRASIENARKVPVRER